MTDGVVASRSRAQRARFETQSRQRGDFSPGWRAEALARAEGDA
jgi:hypothetical protein